MSPATSCSERGATSIDITAKSDFVVFRTDVVFQACQSAVFLYAALISALVFLLFGVQTCRQSINHLLFRCAYYILSINLTDESFNASLRR
jgi:hypothetical protein